MSERAQPSFIDYVLPLEAARPKPKPRPRPVPTTLAVGEESGQMEGCGSGRVW